MSCNSRECENNCIIGLILFLIIYYCVYVVYGLVVLTIDYDIWHVCYLECKNKVWIYCLFSFLLGFDKVYIRKQVVLEYGLGILSMIIIVEILLFSWGIIELFTKTQCLEDKCEDIFRTHLWAFAHLCFVMQIVFIMLYSGLFIHKYLNRPLKFREVELTNMDMV